jgi:hypothetical protein
MIHMRTAWGRIAGLTYLAVLACFGAYQIFGETSWLFPIASIAAVFTAMFINEDASRR